MQNQSSLPRATPPAAPLHAAARPQRSFLEFLLIDFTLFVLLVLLPLMTAADLAFAGRARTWYEVALVTAALIGLALQAIAAFGLLKRRRWGKYVLILSVPLSLGTAAGAMLVLLFLALRRCYSFAGSWFRRCVAQRG